MRLFHNRSLAFLCFIFIATAVFLSNVGYNIKIISAIILGAVTLALIFALIFTSKNRSANLKVTFCFLCILSALLAPLSHLLLVDTEEQKALGYKGERLVSFTVLYEEYKGEHSSEYLVRTESIDNNAEELKMIMVCSFSTDFKAGDKILARAELVPVGTELLGYTRVRGYGEYVQGIIYEDTHFAKLSEGNMNASILILKLKDAFTEHIDAVFTPEHSALAKGFLLGDTSGLKGDELRDFRRSGTSHLLAVSGMHMSVLVGAIGFLLTKCGVPIRPRSFLLSLCAFLLLALSGFSMSACRSVIMLWIVYMSRLYVKENDSVTTLFVAVAFLMLILPSSVSDLSLWLSFLATLGLITVWQPLSIKLSKGDRKGFLGKLKYYSKKLFLSVLLTFICNAFICLAVWYCFGEISIVALLSNPILSPLSSVYMILVMICCIFGSITPLVFITSLLGDLILNIASFFSEISGAVISLRYGFAAPIIILMTFGIIVMLLIKLRRKWLILLPPVLAVIAFSVCLSVHTLLVGTDVRANYYVKDNNELIVLTKGHQAAVIDNSYGSYSFLRAISEIASDECATEISELVLTHYHSRHEASIEKLMRSLIIRNVYLPSPKNAEELERAKNIAEISEQQGATVKIYTNADKIDLLDSSWCSLVREYEREDTSHPSLLALVGNKRETLAYISPETHSSDIAGIAKEAVSKCDKVIFGNHGKAPLTSFDYPVNENSDCIFYSSSELYRLSKTISNGAKIHLASEDKEYCLFKTTLT